MGNLCLKQIDGKDCTRINKHKGKCTIFPQLKDILISLPREIYQKIDKTSQTRGAQPYSRVPYQNRVRRNNRVVIPLEFVDTITDNHFEKGYAIRIHPEDYFNSSLDSRIKLGENAFIFYDTRKRYNDFPIENHWVEGKMYLQDGSVVNDLKKKGSYVKGDYIMRVPKLTTSGEKGKEIVVGKPQGIRFFEYASNIDIILCQIQLAYLVWNSKDIHKVTGVNTIPPYLEALLDYYNLNDKKQLINNRSINESMETVCPLCLKPLLSSEFMELVQQSKGREVSDLTVTQVNLFHLEDLVPGKYGHRPYKLAWGHFHCNTVCRDNGITNTLDWFIEVLKRNNKL